MVFPLCVNRRWHLGFLLLPPQAEPSESNQMLEAMLQGLQQQNAALDAAGASSSTGPVPEWSFESFLQHHPARFDGKCNPDEADHWFRDMERIYETKRCPDENKLAYTQYLLTEEACHWWSKMKMILDGSETHITWEIFKTKFYTEYFPNSVRFDKEIEFLQLVQGSLTVAEYADRIGGPSGSRGRFSSRRVPYPRPSSSSGSKGSSSQPSVHSRQSSYLGGLHCYNIRGPHLQSVCPQMRLLAQVTSSSVLAFYSECLVWCCLIHSFISEACVEKLGLVVEQLDLDLVVSTPASRLVRTSSVCVRCPIIVEGCRFKVNLICLPLQGLEVILGMDWLSANRILIDYGNIDLMFPNEDEDMSLSISVLRQDIMEGASCFLVFSHMEVTRDSD
ncbi:uncharacterized protein LOC108344097 [Vigna angularis]|uniref:uncharacterized protein LOC108344097 n=1 Tax=Phaseolus angularis TaxID=3914 RepID=UPI000809CB7F|nr:uncharacterized protein LOC108344097 [Vigna angularis]